MYNISVNSILKKTLEVVRDTREADKVMDEIVKNGVDEHLLKVLKRFPEDDKDTAGRLLAIVFLLGVDYANSNV